MAKGDKFYFENFTASTALAKEAAEYLTGCLKNYDPANLQEMLQKMHEIENKADVKKHEMREALAKAFVTPVDREDLDMLSHQLDDVVDAIEEVLQKFFMYNITEINPNAIPFALKIVEACDLLCALMGEFENFKRSKTLQPLIIQLNDVEEDCDKLYLASIQELTKDTGDVAAILFWKDIFDSLESCADACEHVSECVGSVIMKNT